jgi:cyanophycin synthetase
MDYCHNVAGLESMADLVKRMDADRTVAMISMPGDRSNEDMEAFGRLAGATFDQIVIREDDNTRGRPSGEIASRLETAVVEGGIDRAKVAVILDEIEAAHATVDLADRNDLVVLLVDKPMAVYEALSKRLTTAGRS